MKTAIDAELIDINSIPGLVDFKYTKVTTTSFVGKDLLTYYPRLQVFRTLEDIVDILKRATGSVYIRDCRFIGECYYLRWISVSERPLDLVFDLEVKKAEHHEFLTPVYDLQLFINRENLDDLLAAHGHEELVRQLSESIVRSVPSIVQRIISL